MRFVALLMLVACSGPISPTHVSRTADPESRVLRPPENAPPDPIGTSRPGDRSCTENRDCKAGDACFAPDYVPAHGVLTSAPPIAASPIAAGPTAATPTTSAPSTATPTAAPSSAAPAPAPAPGAAATAAVPATTAPGTPAPAPTGPPGATPPGATPTAAAPAAAAPAAPTAAAPAAPTSPAAAPLRCQGDGQCTGGQVCASGSCVLPCPQTSCAQGQECGQGGHCMPLRCTEPRAPICAQNSRCDTSSGACERQRCTSRSQCDSGVCFQGRCFAHDAYCMPQGY